MVPLALLQAGGPYICNIIMEKPTIICGVQQVGVGIKDVVEAYNWYIKAFGVDILVADDLGVAERMLPYTGGKPRPRRAVLAANLKGGGGLEVWQPMDNNITPPKEAAALGDYGIAVCKVLSRLKGLTAILDNLKAHPCSEAYPRPHMGSVISTSPTLMAISLKSLRMTTPSSISRSIRQEAFTEP